MVGTIVPVGCGEARLTCYRLIAIYVVSQMLGATLTGLLFGLVGTALVWLYPFDTVVVAAAGIVAIGMVGALSDARVIRFRFPSRDWQVPQHWKRFGPTRMAACYGFGIGVGWLTRIPFSSYYIATCLCVAVADVVGAIVIMLAYGTVRAVAVIVAGWLTMGSRSRADVTVRLLPLVGYIEALFVACAVGLGIRLLAS